MRRLALSSWTLGLALGVWIGQHAHDRLRNLPALDGIVGVALLVASGLLLAVAGSSRGRPPETTERRAPGDD